jgi:hypothetical protein
MPSSHRIHNRSQFDVVAVMDTNRESHPVPPNGTAVFTRANVGDRPTFRIYDDPDRDGRGNRFLTSAKVGYWGALRAESEFEFTGSSLE